MQAYVFLSQDAALVAAGTRYGDDCTLQLLRSQVVFLAAAPDDDDGGGQRRTLSESSLRVVVQVVRSRQQTPTTPAALCGGERSYGSVVAPKA